MWTETGIAAAALTVALVALELIKRFAFPTGRKNGNGKVTVIECPNKIDGLAQHVSETSNRVTQISDTVRLLKQGVDRLVDQHKPEGGVENWKIQPRYVQYWEQIADRQAALLVEVKTQTDALNQRQIALLTELKEQTNNVRRLLETQKQANEVMQRLAKDAKK